jgi:hypothetical protein
MPPPVIDFRDQCWAENRRAFTVLFGGDWVILGQNPPEIAYWRRGEWWPAGDPEPWHAEAAAVVSDRLVFKPRLAPVA